jgi:hypothetical protein
MSLVDTWRRQLQRAREKKAEAEQDIARLERKIARAEKRGKG